MSPGQSQRPVPTERQLAHLRVAGHMSQDEAAGLESARTDTAREAIMRGVRARHAATRLEAAVASGAISAEEAESLIDEVRAGGHSPNLRRRINEIARRTSRGKDRT